MKNDFFSIGLLVFFGICLVIGFVSFAIYGKTQKDRQNQSSSLQEVEIWGVLPKDWVEEIIEDVNDSDSENYLSVSYREVRREDFENLFINAVARDEGPDVILADSDLQKKFYDLTLNVSYSTFSRFNFEQQFLPSSYYVLESEGFRLVPFLVDPFVLFYNENLKSKNNINEIPKSWEDIYSYTEAIDKEGVLINEAIIPIGAYNNYNNFNYLFVTILSQLKNNNIDTSSGLIDFLGYYKSFTNPNSASYTWNSSLKDAQLLFIENKLLFYPGFSSEYRELRRKNPNLTIGVTEIPQVAPDNIKSTVAKMYSFSVSNVSKDSFASLSAIFDLVSAVDIYGEYYINDVGLVPVSRSYKLPESAESRLVEVFDSSYHSFVWNTYDVGKVSIEIYNLLRELVLGTTGLEAIYDGLIKGQVYYDI